MTYAKYIWFMIFLFETKDFIIFSWMLCCNILITEFNKCLRSFWFSVINTVLYVHLLLLCHLMISFFHSGCKLLHDSYPYVVPPKICPFSAFLLLFVCDIFNFFISECYFWLGCSFISGHFLYFSLMLGKVLFLSVFWQTELTVLIHRDIFCKEHRWINMGKEYNLFTFVPQTNLMFQQVVVHGTKFKLCELNLKEFPFYYDVTILYAEHCNLWKGMMIYIIICIFQRCFTHWRYSLWYIFPIRNMPILDEFHIPTFYQFIQ